MKLSGNRFLFEKQHTHEEESMKNAREFFFSWSPNYDDIFVVLSILH